MRALIATIPPIRGGVPAMLRTMLALLAERGIESEVAWYEPYRMTPSLSVPSFRLGTRRPSGEVRAVEGAVAGHALGAWLPELEFTHYRPTRLWRERIAAADLHLVVSGTAMAGLAFERTGTPFLAWLASDWEGDRRDRVAEFPASRRLLDPLVVAPTCRRLERRILRAGHVIALSEATRRALDRVAGDEVVRARLPVPVDLERFRPAPERVVPGRVGLVGRFDDPRKNVRLFLAALALARQRGAELTGLLIGAEATPAIRRELERLGISAFVEVAGELAPAAYADRLATLDLLAVTSHQEGLHVAALEAMACETPVCSTRCGGPEDYVRDLENGALTSADPREVAERWSELARDRERRRALGAAARETVERGYAERAVREIFESELGRFSAASGALARSTVPA